jgi:hypothetical protein
VNPSPTSTQLHSVLARLLRHTAYSTASLIRCNCGRGQTVQISKTNIIPKAQTKNTNQLKYNDISSRDEIRRENEVYIGVSGPECRSKSGNKNRKQIVCKGVAVQVFGDNSKKSKFDSGEMEGD